MKITALQLKQIIKEQLAMVNEAPVGYGVVGSALSMGSLAGISRGAIVATLQKLSVEDFKKLELAMSIVVQQRAEVMQSGKVAGKADAMQSGKLAGKASKFTPASIAKKINASLEDNNWSWAGSSETNLRDAVESVLSAALGPTVPNEFGLALLRRSRPLSARPAYSERVNRNRARETLISLAKKLAMV